MFPELQPWLDYQMSLLPSWYLIAGLVLLCFGLLLVSTPKPRLYRYLALTMIAMLYLSTITVILQ